MFATALLMVAIIPALACAQNESGRRAISKQGFQQFGHWYDSTTAMYQIPFPILRSLPPFNSGMPLDVLLSYIIADSIARFDHGHQTEQVIRGWRTMNDTLRNALRYLYIMTDYNPIILTQYLGEVGSSGCVSLVVPQLRHALRRCAPNTSEAKALYGAIYAGYALRIRVLAVDSMTLKPEPGPATHTMYRAMVEVLDTLKGRVFPSCEQAMRSNNHDALSMSTAPCTSIMFTNATYWDPREQIDAFVPWPAESRLYFARDPAFCTADSSFIMHPGQEAVVFLNYYGQRLDSMYDYFNLQIEPQCSFGALPIIDGKIRDVNHIWSDDLWMEYADWRQRFFAIRDKILVGNY